MKKYQNKIVKEKLKEDVGPNHYKSLIRDYKGKIKDLLKLDIVDGIDTHWPELYLYIKGEEDPDRMVRKLQLEIPKIWRFKSGYFDPALESTSGGVNPITILEFEIEI